MRRSRRSGSTARAGSRAAPGAGIPAVVHRVALVSVVVVNLLIVNVRGGSLFVGQLVRPRAVVGFDPRVDPPTTGSPARVGEAIGVLERLLIVTFMLTGAEAAVGFVIAAKTLARFKQLDDRGFAEYYLLGTLASVSVAIASALLARPSSSDGPGTLRGRVRRVDGPPDAR